MPGSYVDFDIIEIGLVHGSVHFLIGCRASRVKTRSEDMARWILVGHIDAPGVLNFRFCGKILFFGGLLFVTSYKEHFIYQV